MILPKHLNEGLSILLAMVENRGPLLSSVHAAVGKLSR